MNVVKEISSKVGDVSISLSGTTTPSNTTPEGTSSGKPSRYVTSHPLFVIIERSGHSVKLFVPDARVNCRKHFFTVLTINIKGRN